MVCPNNMMTGQCMSFTTLSQTNMNAYLENIMLTNRIERANSLRKNLQNILSDIVSVLYTNPIIRNITHSNKKYENNIKCACSLITNFSKCINHTTLYNFTSFEPRFNTLMSIKLPWNLKIKKIVNLCNKFSDTMLPYTGANMIIDNMSLIDNVTDEEIYCTINDLTPVMQVFKLSNNTALIWCFSVSEALKYASKINGKILCTKFQPNVTYSKKYYLKCSFILTKISIWKNIYSWNSKKNETCFYDIHNNAYISVEDIMKFSAEMRNFTKNDFQVCT
jgi:hypothetical protein